MPQRFLRPGITTSDRWNAVSWKAQSLFIRIITLVDDFGRYDGRVPILHGQCFALRSDVTPKETGTLRGELATAGLIIVYQVDGKEFLQVCLWQERARSETSKFPDPPKLTVSQDSAGNGSGPQEKDASIAIVIDLTPSTIDPRPSPSPTPPDEVEDFMEKWNLLPSAFPKIRTMSAGRKTHLRERRRDLWWRENWQAAIESMPKSDFLGGKNEKQWTADVDFFLRPDSVAKIIEGKYDNRKSAAHTKHGITEDFSHLVIFEA